MRGAMNQATSEKCVGAFETDCLWKEQSWLKYDAKGTLHRDNTAIAN